MKEKKTERNNLTGWQRHAPGEGRLNDATGPSPEAQPRGKTVASKAYSRSTSSSGENGFSRKPCPLKLGRPTRQWLRPHAGPLTGGAGEQRGPLVSSISLLPLETEEGAEEVGRRSRRRPRQRPVELRTYASSERRAATPWLGLGH